MPVKLRQIVSELMIYDADDSLSKNEANAFKEKYKYGAWTVDIAGVRNLKEFNDALKGFVNIKQLSICSHGSSGRVPFKTDALTMNTLSRLNVPTNLFDGPGKLLFMGCETAATKAGEDFLVAAGKRFFAGKGGFVGGSTVSNLGFSFGTRIPLLDITSWKIGKLIIFQLDGKGNVVKRKDVKPLGF